jgi:hypothetical protein
MGVCIVLCMSIMGVKFSQCALVRSSEMLSCLDLVLVGCTCLDLPSCGSTELDDNKVHLVAGGDVSRPMCVFSWMLFVKSMLGFSLWPPCCNCLCLSCVRSTPIFAKLHHRPSKT